MRALTAIQSTPWLITPDALEQIVQIASREQLDPELAALIRAERDARPSALAARAGQPLDGAAYTSVRDGVAIVPVVGPIFRYADFFTSFSGGTTTEHLAQDIGLALTDPSVAAVLLSIDSPGGEAGGIHELAAQIRAGTQQKPIVAYVEDYGASAAYWLASACDAVVCDATAALGSIGVVLAVPNPDKADARRIEIVSSQSPRKRPNVATEAGRSQLQQYADDLAAVFVATVAQYRGVDESTVLAQFGAGGLLVGQKAVDAGMADRLGSFEGTLATLAQQARGGARRPLPPLPMFSDVRSTAQWIGKRFGAASSGPQKSRIR